jgi:hypothetical protein
LFGRCGISNTFGSCGIGNRPNNDVRLGITQFLNCSVTPINHLRGLPVQPISELASGRKITLGLFGQLVCGPANQQGVTPECDPQCVVSLTGSIIARVHALIRTLVYGGFAPTVSDRNQSLKPNLHARARECGTMTGNGTRCVFNPALPPPASPPPLAARAPPERRCEDIRDAPAADITVHAHHHRYAVFVRMQYVCLAAALSNRCPARRSGDRVPFPIHRPVMKQDEMLFSMSVVWLFALCGVPRGYCRVQHCRAARTWAREIARRSRHRATLRGRSN